MEGVDGITDLMTFAFYGDHDEVQFLLTQPGDILATDSQGLNVLFYAVLGSFARQWLSGPVREGLATGLRLQWFNRCMATLLVLTALWMARI